MTTENLKEYISSLLEASGFVDGGGLYDDENLQYFFIGSNLLLNYQDNLVQIKYLDVSLYELLSFIEDLQDLYLEDNEGPEDYYIMGIDPCNNLSEIDETLILIYRSWD